MQFGVGAIRHRADHRASRSPSGAAASWFMPMVALVTVWWTNGFSILLFLAGLRNIPPEIYEAAALEGANRWQLFRSITWPLIWPVTALCLTIQLILQLKIFDQVYLFSLGGRTNQTMVLVQYIYEQAFVHNKGGYGATIAVALFVDRHRRFRCCSSRRCGRGASNERGAAIAETLRPAGPRWHIASTSAGGALDAAQRHLRGDLGFSALLGCWSPPSSRKTRSCGPASTCGRTHSRSTPMSTCSTHTKHRPLVPQLDHHRRRPSPCSSSSWARAAATPSRSSAFPAATCCGGMILASFMVPIQALIVNHFVIMSDVGLLNTLSGIILPQLILRWCHRLQAVLRFRSARLPRGRRHGRRQSISSCCSASTCR